MESALDDIGDHYAERLSVERDFLEANFSTVVDELEHRIKASSCPGRTANLEANLRAVKSRQKRKLHLLESGISNLKEEEQQNTNDFYTRELRWALDEAHRWGQKYNGSCGIVLKLSQKVVEAQSEGRP